MELYHGTNNNYATDIKNGRIDVTRGGGELGRGFYTGDLSHEAFNWAWHQYKRDKAVVQFELDDNDVLNLNPLCTDLYQTHSYRRHIRNRGETKTFLFKRNAVWAPVVGKYIPNFNQIKFESKPSEVYINGSQALKTIL